jgi:hypothetical protein
MCFEAQKPNLTAFRPPFCRHSLATALDLVVNAISEKKNYNTKNPIP